MLIIGIDPGKQGAVAFLNSTAVLSLKDTPTLKGGKREEYDAAAMVAVLRWLETVTTTEEGVHVFLEKAWGAPGQSSVATFSQGEGLGLWKGIIASLALPYTAVAPVTWKKVMLADVSKTAEGKAAEKRQMKVAAVTTAQRLFPRYAGAFVGPRGGIMDGRAEAALLAEYGRRVLTGLGTLPQAGSVRPLHLAP